MDTSLVGAVMGRWVWLCMCVCLFVKRGFTGTVCLANGVGGQRSALWGEQLISRSRWEHGECVSWIRRHTARPTALPLLSNHRTSADISLPCLVSSQPVAGILTFQRTLPPRQWSFHLPWQWHVANGYLALRDSHRKQNPSSAGSFNVHIRRCRCYRWTIGTWGRLSLRWNWDFVL